MSLVCFQTPRERLKLDEILHHPFMQDPLRPVGTAMHRLVSTGGVNSTGLPPLTESKLDTGTSGSRLTKVCPLNATRLRPMQHDTYNVLVSTFCIWLYIKL